jgi:hypothetical protein
MCPFAPAINLLVKGPMAACGGGRSLKDRLPKSGTGKLTPQHSTASPIVSG